MPSYVCDTTNFLQILDKGDKNFKQQPACNSGCEIIVHKYAKELSHKSYEKGLWKPPYKSNSSKSDHGVFKIYTLNNFPFKSIDYLQIKGYAMDTIFGPVCTSTILIQLEKEHRYRYIKTKLSLYLQYMDDIFHVLQV